MSQSSVVEPGSLYVFLSDGTLVLTSPHGRPAFGSWKAEGGGLTMVEEGIPYKVKVVELNQGEFRIKSYNPGQAVDITLVPTEQPSWPK
ncbi:MAG: hypothetical protein ABIR01_02825 [Candidatus Eisenbacteria bacterium]